VAPLAALATVGALAACDPPIPPDGRDLGIAIDGPLPATVTEGTDLLFSGTVTNHGTAPATGVTLTYAAPGFSVSGLDFDGADVCDQPSEASLTCTLAEPLGPGESFEVSYSAVAGETSGAHTHLVAVSSDGSEPDPDPNTNLVLFDTDVRPWADEPTPLYMGNGTNYLGTGSLLAGSGRPAEGFNLGINTYCSDRVNGDRYQSGFSGGLCSGAPNPEYRAGGYTYSIHVPAARSSDIDVMIWDARYSDATLPSGEASPDQVRQPGQEPFTFSLLAADDTPFDTTDNPVLCSSTFGANTPFDEVTYLGSSRWNSLCTIAVGQPAGEYLVKVTNSGSTIPNADGSNQFGIVARPVAHGTDPVTSLCNWSARPDCPVVSGPGVVSTWIDVEGALTRVPLGEVTPDQEGRVLRLELFDPGEGMSAIRIMAPTGASSWSRVPFTWSSDNGLSGAGSSLNVRNSVFNGRTVTIEVDLAGYEAPAGNMSWWVEYEASPGQVTDRTTWDASVVDAEPQA